MWQTCKVSSSASPSEVILHLLPAHQWRAAAPETPLRPGSLAQEGFVHCSSPEQLADVANALFAGRQDLLLLIIDPEKLDAEVVWEDCYDAGAEYPHVYGPINRDAIIGVVAYQAGTDGSFCHPDLGELS